MGQICILFLILIFSHQILFCYPGMAVFLLYHSPIKGIQDHVVNTVLSTISLKPKYIRIVFLIFVTVPNL